MPNSASSRVFSLCIIFHSGKPPTRHSIRISFWCEGCWSLIFPKEWEAWEFHMEKKIKLLFLPTLRWVPTLTSQASASLLFTLLVFFFIYSQIFSVVSYLHGFYNSTTLVLYCLHLIAVLQISKKKQATRTCAPLQTSQIQTGGMNHPAGHSGQNCH